MFSAAADDGPAPRDSAQLNAAIQLLENQALARFRARQYVEAGEAYTALVEALRQKFPKDRYPQGHASLVQALSAVATCHANRGRHAAARKGYEAALEMAQALYPEEKYPDGHADLAGLLSRLGKVLHAHGEYSQAGRRGLQALAMYRKLYPEKTHPDGHAELARALHMMGFYTGGGDRALKLYQEALAMQRRLYPRDKFPNGHPDLLQTLNSLGNLHLARRDVGGAIVCLTESLEYSRRQLEATPNLATIQSVATNAKYVGRLCSMGAQHEMAEQCYALQMRLLTAFFSRDLYPHGHDTLALAHYDLGWSLHMQGKIAEAMASLREAERMWHGLATQHLGEVSEAEALNYLVHHLATPSMLLSASRHAEDEDASIYAMIWSRRGIVHRVTSRRHQALRDASDEKVRETFARYQQTRRALAALMLAPAGGRPTAPAGPARAASRTDRPQGATGTRIGGRRAAVRPRFGRASPAAHRSGPEPARGNGLHRPAALPLHAAAAESRGHQRAEVAERRQLRGLRRASR